MTKQVPEYIVRAVADAQGASEYETAETALRWLLHCAWDDLGWARGSAANGRWSMACDSAVGKIVGLTGLVGPISWEEVQIDLLLDGTYERVCAAMGVPGEFDRVRVVALHDKNGRLVA